MNQSDRHLRENNLEFPIMNSHESFKLSLIFLGIIILYIIIRLNIINIPLDRDEGIFGYIGQVINANGVPYKDAIDQKPPVVFFINALALRLFPPNASGIHLFLHFYNLLTLFVLFFTVKNYSNSISMAMWTAFVYAILSSSRNVQGFTASSEMFMLLPMSLSLLFIVLAIRKESVFYCFSSGVCGALTFWTKQTGAFVILFILLYFISNIIQKIHTNKKTVSYSIREVLAWGSGFIFISLMIAGYFYFHHAFHDFVYWSFTHTFFYSQKINFLLIWPRISESLFDLFTENFMIIFPGIIGCMVMVTKSEKKGSWALSFLLFSFVATCPGYAYGHYFAQILPGLAVTTGIGTVYLVELSSDKLKYKIFLTLFCLTVLIPLIVNSDYYIKNSPEENSRAFFGYEPFPESVDLANYIKERTTEKDKVLIFGSEAQIFVYSQRKSATAFALFYPLMSSYPKYMEFQQRTWKDIQENDPKYIIFIEIQTTFLYDGKVDLWILKKTQELLSAGYDLEAVMTIDYPKGRIITISEKETGNETLKREYSPIRIFRKKDV